MSSCTVRSFDGFNDETLMASRGSRDGKDNDGGQVAAHIMLMSRKTNVNPECIAKETKRPLLSLSVADLGTEEIYMERNLTS